MPTISIFYGIVIRMFLDDHGLPNFHAQYGEYKATVDIVSLSLAEGRLPRRALELVLDWAELHQDELREDWELCREHQVPRPIEPLQ